LSKRKRPLPHIFLGWWSVLFIGIISGLGHGFNTYGISVIFLPISAELGLNRAATSWAPGIGRFEGGVTSPLVGWLADKFGPRWIVISGICIAGCGMILMYFITEVWHYYIAWGALIGLGLNIGLAVAVDKKINDWFIRRRGLAQGIKFALMSIFGIVVIQIMIVIIDSQGWRFACLIWGILMFASVPLAFWLIKPQRPEYYGMLPDGADVSQGTGKDEEDMITRGVGYASSFEETEYTFKQAIKTVTFWLLTVGLSVHNIVAISFSTHIFPFLKDTGINDATAGGMMSMMIFFTAISRLLGGILADRIPKSRLQLILIGAFLLQFIGIGTFLLYQNVAASYVLLVCHGLSAGILTPLIILSIGRYFGRKAFGLILGTMLACMAPMALIAPVYYGWIHDTTGSYNIAFITALILVALAIASSSFIRAPKPPVVDSGRLTW
jgi:cyanate permease